MADSWFKFAKEDHFWIKRRYELIILHGKKILGRRNKYLEIGCGEGTFQSMIFKKNKIKVEGCDLNYTYLKNNNSRQKLFCYNILEENKKFKNKYDCLFLLDVIEHIKNDLNFLKSASKMLKNGGHIILNVPAGSYLFSKYDQVAGHQKRYNYYDIYELCQKSNLKLINFSYWGMLFVPLLILRKFFLQIVKQKNVIKAGFDSRNKYLNRLFYQLIKIEPKSNKFFGTSILCILRK